MRQRRSENFYEATALRPFPLSLPTVCRSAVGCLRLSRRVHATPPVVDDRAKPEMTPTHNE